MDFSEAIEFLDRLDNHEKRPPVEYSDKTVHLQQLSDTLTELQSPHDQYPSIHIAGTKGKGSTAIMTESLLQSLDYSVGTFTSPHLVDVRDRIRLNGSPISKESFSTHFETLLLDLDINSNASVPDPEPPVDSLTYFEFMTLLSMYIFREEDVDVGIFEVGLGGKLDATNVISPLISVITTIGLDHTEYLGDTLSEIAEEKGGIIKENTPLITSEIQDEPLNVLRELAEQRQAPMTAFKKDFSLLDREPLSGPGFSQKIHLQTSRGTQLHLRMGIPGETQAMNLATAVESCEQYISREHETTSLQQNQNPKPDRFQETIRMATRSMSLPGRFQLYNRVPPVILDVAHNPISCDSLVTSLEEAELTRGTLLFGVFRKKNWKEMLQSLTPIFESIVLTKLPEQRSEDPGRIQQWLLDEQNLNEDRVQVTEDPLPWLEHYIEDHEQNPLVVTGSCYLVGRILRETE